MSQVVSEIDLKVVQKKEEQLLIKQAAAGDRESFRVLVERYQSRAMALALNIMRNKQDAEDVVQESFVKAYLALKTFEMTSSFYTWLYRIVHNMAIDYKRKLQRHSKHEIRASVNAESDILEQIQPAAPEQEQPEKQLASKQGVAVLKKAFEGLSVDQQEVLRLREFDGCSYKQISKALGVSEGTVMSRIFYARKKLQETLGV